MMIHKMEIVLIIHVLCALNAVVGINSYSCDKKPDVCGCVFTNSTGQYLITMSEIPFYKDQEPSGGGNEWLYSLDLCKGFSELDGCEDVTGCQIYESTNSFPLGKQGSEEYSAYTDQSVTLSNSVTYKGKTRTMKVILSCTNDAPPKLVVTGQAGTLLYEFAISAKSLCPRKYKPTPSNSSKSSGGLSIGSILVIVFFVVLIVYFVSGILFMKYRREATGKEIIPNVEFWSSLPGLIKDGCVFLFQKMRQLCQRDSYQEI